MSILFKKILKSKTLLRDAVNILFFALFIFGVPLFYVSNVYSSESNTSEEYTNCTDGFDNDSDSLVDGADPECLIAPGTPDLLTDNGGSGNDDITNATQPNFSVACNGSLTVRLWVGPIETPSLVGSGTCSGGTVTITSDVLNEGGLSIYATQYNGSSDSSYSNGLGITTDFTSPSGSGTPDLQAGSDTGPSSTDDNTNDTTPTFDISCEESSTVELMLGGVQKGYATCSGGTASVTSSSISAGAHEFTSRQTDLAGNGPVNSADPTLTINVDTTAPSTAGTPDLQAGSDTGADNTDNITTDTTPTFDVSCDESGGTVSIYSNPSGEAVLLGTGNCNPSTAVVTVSPALSAGSYTIAAKQTDVYGNVSGEYSSTLDFTIESSDVTPPTVSGVNSSTIAGSYNEGDSISIQVNFTESVTVTGTPQLTLETGDTDRTINYASGSGSSSLTFTYTVQAGDTSSDLDYVNTSSLSLNGGTIRDAASNNATLTLATPGASGSLGANEAFVIDTTAPTVDNVTSSTSNGSYNEGDAISIQVTFDEAVTVTGTPQLTLETGGTDAVVNYSSGSGTTALTFTYTIASGETSSDLDYASTGALALNSGTIKDTAGNDATLTLATPGAANSLGANKAIVVDTTSPSVSLTAPTDASTVSGVSVTISATASDTNLSGVQFKRDTNTNIGSEDTTSAYSVTWDTTGLSDGSQTLIAVARDSAGNYATSTSITVTVDNTAPVISEVTPITTPTTDTTPNYVFTTDEAGTITYGGSCSSGTTSATSGSNTITLTTLADGTYSNCTITVTDASDNVSNTLTITSFTVSAPAEEVVASRRVTSGSRARSNTTPAVVNTVTNFVNNVGSTFISDVIKFSPRNNTIQKPTESSFDNSGVLDDTNFEATSSEIFVSDEEAFPLFLEEDITPIQTNIEKITNFVRESVVNWFTKVFNFFDF